MSNPSNELLLSIVDPVSGADRQSQLDALLLLAAGDGDLAAVRQCLSEGANPCAKHPGPSRPWVGGSPLHIAAREDNVAIVSELLPRSDPNALDDSNTTALIIAVFYGNDEIIAMLAPVTDHSLCGDDGLTAFQWAIRQQDESALRQLLPYEERCPALSSRGETALMIAADEGSLDYISQLLLINDPMAKNEKGLDALMFAAGAGDVGAIQRLAPHSDLAATSTQGKTAADIARDSGNGQASELLRAMALAATEKAALSAQMPISSVLKKNRL